MDAELEVAFETVVLGILRPGYRCLHLRSLRGTRIQLCALLVHIDIGTEVNLFAEKAQLKSLIVEQHTQITEQSARLAVQSEELAAQSTRLAEQAKEIAAWRQAAEESPRQPPTLGSSSDSASEALAQTAPQGEASNEDPTAVTQPNPSQAQASSAYNAIAVQYRWLQRMFQPQEEQEVSYV